ncbi:MAG: putative conserved domain protein [uncultured Nocardioidaceae bacterium]|uniref:Putative conserved domain protein n=1 Tax=uncultured Nocardioidaceae bacterium TaxID=253824 RepID=A0A6J4M7D8_9ACTN|nr:MAG: putative conserved domain protein [uncultured Nocardioidaceae bacterium]
MISSQEIGQVVGSTAYDSDGDKIGKVGQVYLDDETNQPAWVTINTGLFGTSESFAPIESATFSGDRLTLAHDSDKVKNAPNVADDGHLSHEEEQSLYQYYGMSYGSSYTETTTAPTEAVTTQTQTAPVDDAMTRSEESVQVGTTSQEAGRARLRKYVETEQVQEAVPVRKERAVVETEPITDENYPRSVDGPEITEAQHEVVLHEETAVAEKTVEPVERVRLGTEEVVEQQTVSEDVRKERITTEGDGTTTGTTGTTGGTVS